jgi:hypothetical protein
MSGARLVQPARLRHTNAVPPFVAHDGMQKRNLHRQGQFAREPAIGARIPEHQARRRRQQMQRAGEIGLSHALRQRAKGAKGQKIMHRIEPLVVAQQQVLRPGRQGALAPMRKIWVVARR